MNKNSNPSNSKTSLQLEEEKFDPNNNQNLISIKSRGSIPGGGKFNTKLNKLMTNVSTSKIKV